MHWRHSSNNKLSERLYKVDEIWKYKEQYYNDYYTPDTPITLKTFGLCSRAPEDHIINRYVEKYVLHYILAGKGWCNGVPFEAGDIVYCAQETPYNISSNRSDPCTHAWVSFQGGKSEKYIAALGLKQPFKCYKAKFPHEINKILYDMMEVDHSDVQSDLYLEGCFLHLLALSAPTDTDETEHETPKHERRISAAIQYIANHFRQPDLRLEDVALATNTNEKYLQRLFKAETGMSIYQYLSKLRMDAAITLLGASNYNINEIAEYVGYNDRKRFTEIFKKRFGVSPSKYSSDL